MLKRISVSGLRAIALGLMWIAATGVSHAQQGCPKDRPIRLVVPFPAGGGTDIVARRLGDHLRKELGQPVIVENRAGATGNIGADNVAHSAPDGCTLMLTAAPFAIAPAIFKNLPFDPVRDFTSVAQIAIVPLLVVTRSDSPLKSLADLEAAAKAKPDAVSYGTFGTGAPPHLVGVHMQSLGKFQMTHVPYKGGQAALPDLVSGQLDVAILDVVSMIPLISSGRLKALAITGPKRTTALPDVPTLTEAGVPFDTVGWYGLFGPAKMDPAVVARLNAAANKAMALPEMRAMLVDGGALPVDTPPTASQWQTQFAEQVQTWGKIARDAHITLD